MTEQITLGNFIGSKADYVLVPSPEATIVQLNYELKLLRDMYGDLIREYQAYRAAQQAAAAEESVAFEELRREAEDWQDIAEERGEEIADLNRSYDALYRIWLEAKNDSATLAERVLALNTKSEERGEIITSLYRDIEVMQDSLAASAGQVRELKADNASLRSAIEAWRVENDALRAAL